MIDVTVKIPEERIGGFYELVGRWLSGERLAEEVTETSVGLKDWTNSDEDVVLARVVWEKFSPHAKALFSSLMEEPGRKMSGEGLATALGIPNGKAGVAGVLAWPARHCAAVNRIGPWCWEYRAEGEGADYWVEPEVTDLFNRVRN